MLTVTFDELQAALEGVVAPMAAAEAHGALCGQLAAHAGYSADDWLRQLVPDSAAGEAELRARNLLGTVYAETAAALVGQQMEFAPILPEDAESLERRVAALADWCAAFLFGLGTGALPPPDEMPSELAEVLKDFGEISRAVPDTGESAESSEESYVEVVEYVRAGTQLAFEELAEHREQAARA